MKLIDDWRAELNRLWSIKFSLSSAIFGVLELVDELLPLFVDYVPSRIFLVMSVISAIGAMGARLIRQAE